VRVKVPAGPPWDVRWHPEATKEKEAVKADGDTREHKAINAVVEALKVNGPTLPFPHQSDIKGNGGDGLRELRPRQGRSPWRGIYRRFDNTFVILAVGPEAEVDRSDFNAAVKAAQQRRKGIEDTDLKPKPWSPITHLLCLCRCLPLTRGVRHEAQRYADVR
jgi:hypothetical protein